MSDHAHGGNDRLIGGIGDDLLVGDAQVMSATARGGNDRLWGDPTCAARGRRRHVSVRRPHRAGHRLRFPPGRGGLLDLRAYGFTDVGDLSTHVAGGSTVIDIGASLGEAAHVDTIRLEGSATLLTNSDFLFA